MKPTYEELEQQLEESRREFRAADATIHNLELKVEQVVAENAGLKNAVDIIETKYMNWEGLSDAFSDARGIKTPATDAFLAEVRAQGVDMFALMFAEEAIKSNNITTGWRAKASRAASEYAEALREDAAQLRQGAAL